MDVWKRSYRPEHPTTEGTNVVNPVSIPRRITATYTAQLGSSLGTKMARAVLVILAGKILVFLAFLAVVAAGIETSLTTHSAVTTFSVVFLAVLASAPVMMIQVIANMYRMHLVGAIAKRMILRDPKLGRYRAQEMVSSAKLAPWLELHPGFVEHSLSLDPRIPKSVPSAPPLCHLGTYFGSFHA